MAKKRKGLTARLAAVEKSVASVFTAKKKKAKKAAKKSKSRSKPLAAARKAKGKTKSTRKRPAKKANRLVAPKAKKATRPRKVVEPVLTSEQLAPSGEPNFVTPTETL